jgi:hypothetical protein
MITSRLSASRSRQEPRPPRSPLSQGSDGASPAPLPARRPCRGPRRASVLMSLPWPAECAVEHLLDGPKRRPDRPRNRSGQPGECSTEKRGLGPDKSSSYATSNRSLSPLCLRRGRPVRARQTASPPSGKRRGDLVAAPPSSPISSVYGVGSLPDQPKMSVLPNLAAQSCCGAGRGTSSLTSSVRRDIRQASMAGQSAAFRASFHTAAP